ncbi:MAG: hypothetical protein RL376_1635 [Verrucomicrobiota bacterium]
MSLEKFIYLLLESKLVLTQASRFTDQNEFALHIRRVEAQIKKNNNPPESLYVELETANLKTKELKEKIYVSSWSIDRFESYALWKIYLGGASTGVAVRTSVSRLQRSLKESPYEFAIAKVRYTNFIPPDAEYGDLLICSKMSSYYYERELRLFCKHVEKPGTGFAAFLPTIQPPILGVNVDLNELIDTIYLSPFAGDWFHSSFRKLIKSLAPTLSAKIKTSEVRDQ